MPGKNNDGLAESLVKDSGGGLRTDLKDLNLTKEQVKELVRLSHHPNLFNNPVPVTDDMLFELYGTMNSRSFVLK